MTIAENFGVDDRGRFYDAVGAMRDVIQNHALQVLGLIGMEPPSGNDPDSIRDKKLEFFKAMRAADPKRYVRGQYDGFLEVKDVDPKSTTETFAALELDGRQLALERRPLLRPRGQVPAGRRPAR